MDDLQDAIQDAQYIGAMVDVPRPSRPIDLPSDEEALEFADHLRATRSDALAIDTLLSEPLGFYLVRWYAGDPALWLRLTLPCGMYCSSLSSPKASTPRCHCSFCKMLRRTR